MINNDVKIAVVIATYNGEKYIKEQLDSVLVQTLMPSEIIIQDDNSSDSTWDILCEYKKMYPNLIKLYKNKQSLGAHMNFEKAFNFVTADYIAPCDQDDIWMPRKLEYSYEALKEGSYSLVACKELIRYEDGSEKPNYYPMPSLEDCIFNKGIAGHLIMIPKNAIKVFDIADKITFDFGLTVYAACANGGKIIDYNGCIWRRHSAVITAEYSNHNPFSIKNISKWKKLSYVLKATFRGEHSQVIERREYAIHQIISYFLKEKKNLKIYDYLTRCMISQSPIKILFAGVVYSHIKSKSQEYKSYSLKSKIANRLYNLCVPAMFWYDYHDRSAL